MEHRLLTIPSGEAGTDATLKEITTAVNNSLKHPAIRLLAVEILNRSGAPARNALAQAESLYRWVTNNINYLKDPVGVELIQRPEITVKQKQGDCDDHAVLLGALASAVGLPIRFKVVGAKPSEFRHIFPEIKVNGKWLTADTTSQKPLGSEPAVNLAEKIYYLTGESKMLSQSVVMPQNRINTASVQKVVHDAVYAQINANWMAGLIDRSDVQGYLRVIDERNAPFEQTPWLKAAIRQGVSDFLSFADKSGLKSSKVAGSLSGLEGLDGFLSSVWNAAKSVIKPLAVGAATILGGPVAGAAAAGVLYTPTGGGSTATTQPASTVIPINPAVKIPVGSSGATITYQAASPVIAPAVVTQPSTLDTLLKNPVVLIGGGVLAVVLIASLMRK